MRKLKGERYIKKEYSYIFLHFMGDYFKDILAGEAPTTLVRDLEEDYSLAHDEILIEVKKQLSSYAMDEKEGKKWEFLSDEQWEKQKQAKKRARQASKIEVEETDPLREIELIRPDEKELEEIVVIGHDRQKLIRILRNKYIHWSAEKVGIGNEPTGDRIRREF